MKQVAYELEHSVEVHVSCAFAWTWRTDIRNWDDPPAKFSLDGPFDDGSCGTTLLPGREPLRWQIRDVRPEKSFAVEMLLDGAALCFEWRFDVVSGDRMRLTQRIVLTGDNAASYAMEVRAGFGANLASGMRRMAAAMEAAASAKGAPSR